MIKVKADRRNLILERLDAILKAMSIELSTGTIAAGNFVRNRGELPKEKVPGIILLDADEVFDKVLTPNRDGRGDVQPVVGLMRMTPEIYVVLEVRKPNNPNVGMDLNQARSRIIGKLINDATLKTIVGANGQILYDGCVTDLARNRQMEGQLGMSFTFVYPFVPTEFIETVDVP